jgi:predicted DNA binding CopG/RHH family protein
MSRFPKISDQEEQELVALSEEDGWVPVGNIEEQRAFWQKVARDTLDGERQRISISIPKRDLAKLKTRAAEEGMPYQTLINSILHKYVES